MKRYLDWQVILALVLIFLAARTNPFGDSGDTAPNS